MNQNKYWIIFCALAFFAFAAVSCWATAESLHFLQPDIPIVFMWIVSIGFFVIASLGSKMIVDSLNKNVYTEHPGLKITGGVIVMLVFWLICSMPTNTHTFFYTSNSRKIATDELFETRDYLNQLKNDQKNQVKANDEAIALERKVNNILTRLHSEIDNPANPGVGPEVERLINELEIEVGDIQKIKPNGNSQSAWNEYEQKIREAANRNLESKIKGIRGVSVEVKNKQGEIKNFITAITSLLNQLDSGVPIDTELSKQIESKISGAKSIIGSGKTPELIDFKIGDKENYIGENTTKSRFGRLKSVFDVWEDFFAGKLAGLGFGFWILIAVLVDLAGFIFFDIAFRKTH